jgi:NAD(P)-dependent dehydrogenase (short-subunit alcohol dehydrogenase family)
MEEAIVQLGRLDCVIVNAGINSWPASFVELESEEYLRVLATNQHGAFYTLREAVRHMTTRAKEGDPGGSLIVCGSLTVVAGVGRIEHYSASKGALMGMTRSIAVEYRHQGIRANMLLPGRIASDLPGASRSEITEGFERIPIPRQGTPQDLEGIVVYLMSDASAHHTGDMIAIDGGLSITLPGRDGHRTSSDTGTRPQ